MQEQPNAVPWQNGVTLKRIKGGYSSTIAIAADSSSEEALLEAVRKTAVVDQTLREMYGDPEDE